MYMIFCIIECRSHLSSLSHLHCAAVYYLAGRSIKRAGSQSDKQTLSSAHVIILPLALRCHQLRSHSNRQIVGLAVDISVFTFCCFVNRPKTQSASHKFSQSVRQTDSQSDSCSGDRPISTSVLMCVINIHPARAGSRVTRNLKP